jgi:hypothetical protein
MATNLEVCHGRTVGDVVLTDGANLSRGLVKEGGCRARNTLDSSGNAPSETRDRRFFSSCLVQDANEIRQTRIRLYMLMSGRWAAWSKLILRSTSP